MASKLIGGRYELADRVGSGGMGVVWRAHDNLLDRTVAVNQLLITPGLSTAEADEATNRALREGRIAARLHHPHAIAVYDVAEEDGLPWLIMEFLPSRSLADVIDERGTLTHLETARIGAQVASALAVAHAAGIVHRDIKPANVLMGDDGSVKITDFGISRATGDVTVTATGMVSGTPAYLAPEVARGEYPEPPADVFSLGALLYTMIEGTPPFGQRDNTFALLHAVAAGEIEPPRKPGPLTPLLLDMLASEPERRPTMRQAQAVLERVAAGVPAGPIPADPTARITMPPRQPQTPVPVPTAAFAPPRTQPEPRQRAAEPSPTMLDSPRPEPPRTLFEPPPAAHEPPRPVPPPRRAVSSPPPATPARASKGGRRGVGLIVSVVLVGSLVAIGVLVAVLLGNRDNSSDKAGTADASISVSEQAGTDVTFDDMSQFVRNYYALLPGDTDAAYAELSTNYQGSNPRSSYDAFWADIESVTVDSVTPGNNGSVNVALTYETKSGTTKTENRWIAVYNNGGDLVIWSSETF